MKNIFFNKAGYALIGALLLFLVSSYLQASYSWAGFIRAFAEAAMIGGLADWFAVVALFRHPLGLKLPHTAIVPNNKDRIAVSLGDFVQKHFLSPEVLVGYLKKYDLPSVAAEWLDRPSVMDRISEEAVFAVKESINFFNDDDIKKFVTDTVSSKVRNYRFSPLVGKLLSSLAADDRHLALLDNVLLRMEEYIEKDGGITPDSPFWHIRDDLERLKLYFIKRELKQISRTPDHKFKKVFDEKFRELIDDLEQSRGYICDYEDRIKEELLGNPAVVSGIGSLWSDLKEYVMADIDREDSGIREQVRRLLGDIFASLLSNVAVQNKINLEIQTIVGHLAENYRKNIGDFIAEQVKGWDNDKITDVVEGQIGEDLQYIRLNGTIVGGLIGVVIYTVGVYLLPLVMG